MYLIFNRINEFVEMKKRKSGTASVNTTANGATIGLHVQLRCGSLSITTPASHLANESDVRSELHGQVSLAVVKQFFLCRS